MPSNEPVSPTSDGQTGTGCGAQGRTPQASQSTASNSKLATVSGARCSASLNDSYDEFPIFACPSSQQVASHNGRVDVGESYPSLPHCHSSCLAPPAIGTYVDLPAPRVATLRIALDRLKWPRTARQTVPGLGFCIGATRDAKGAMFTMPFNADQAECVQAANQLIHDCGLSGFHWTSLQFNKNTVACEHTDKHNKGLSLVIILGDFTGGSLCVPSRSIVTSPNIHPVGIIIDGTEYHRSTQFVGTRYSIVAFMHTSYDELSLKQREKLTQLDFRLP